MVDKRPKSILITAAGKGRRMQSDIPKQFLPVNGVPILMHTIEAFVKYDANINIILILPKKQQQYWFELCEKFGFNHIVNVVQGGPTRYHSVKNGLDCINEENGVVGIHDGVRPLVSQKTIAECYRMAKLLGNAIPTVHVTESVRIVENAFNKPVDRNKLRIIQTPQCFKTAIIRQAYNKQYNENFTDDASVVEKSGEQIYLTEGNPENIKITSPMDMKIASVLLKTINQ